MNLNHLKMNEPNVTARFIFENKENKQNYFEIFFRSL